MNNGGIFHGAAQGFAQSALKMWGGGEEGKGRYIEFQQ